MYPNPTDESLVLRHLASFQTQLRSGPTLAPPHFSISKFCVTMACLSLPPFKRTRLPFDSVATTAAADDPPHPTPPARPFPLTSVQKISSFPANFGRRMTRQYEDSSQTPRHNFLPKSIRTDENPTSSPKSSFTHRCHPKDEPFQHHWQPRQQR